MAFSFWRPAPIFTSAILLRVGLFLWGLYQDTHSPVKYTDIDYVVFTDASRYVSNSQSPYDRDTYRYTPILAWMLLPTAWAGWFSFGKFLFAISDIVTGWLIVKVLRKQRMSKERALKYASIWLLNPMVATISTRGSSEGLLAMMVVVLLWAVMSKRIVVAGVLLGLGVHFKIYPFIYAPGIVWWSDDEHFGKARTKTTTLVDKVKAMCSPERITLAVTGLATFMALNGAMYYMYGFPFLQHTYLHHVTRVDHRHNFSPYNILLYLRSASPVPSKIHLESVAFIPQMLLSGVILPLLLAKKDLPSTLLAQTFAFVTFNKVCTSQYFLWYMVFLPFYVPNSSFMRSKTLGISALVLWVATQAAWLQQGFQLEFLGKSTFTPGLWLASQAFFLTNAWILGIIVSDIGQRASSVMKVQVEPPQLNPSAQKERIH